MARGLAAMMCHLALLLLFAHTTGASFAGDAVSNFRQYLRIRTVHPEPDYEAAENFLKGYAKNLSLDVNVMEFETGAPVILMSWKGSDPEAESVLLNSHMDVVPVEQDKWREDAFEAVREASGDILGRGSQDMKCVGIQYLEAIRKLQAKGFKPVRSVHVLFVPNEEIGGHEGMERFVASEEFTDIKVGVALDEGLASPTEDYRVFYGERTLWWLTIKAVGEPGHGSKLFDGSAAENLFKSLALISKYREEEFNAFKDGEAAEAEVTSINLSFLKAGTPSPTGFVMNLQPSEAEAGFDIRIPPTADFEELERRIREEWAPEERNMTYRFVQKNLYRSLSGQPLVTPYDESNPWWAIFSTAVEKTGINLSKPEIFPAATDGRYLRIQDFPVIGFSPMRETPVLLHAHNEFLNEAVFLEGIDVYENVIAAMSTFNGATGPSYTLREEL